MLPHAWKNILIRFVPRATVPFSPCPGTETQIHPVSKSCLAPLTQHPSLGFRCGVSEQEGTLQDPKVCPESLLQLSLLPKLPATLYCRSFTKHPCVATTPTSHAMEWRPRLSGVHRKETGAQSACPLFVENGLAESSASGFEFMVKEALGESVAAHHHTKG